jgi:cardiolipin synthase
MRRWRRRFRYEGERGVDMNTPPKSSRWVGGNHFELLENGEEFFPRVFEAIAQAQREVLLETFILFDDKVGRQLHATLLAAAKRGVSIDVTIDGYGSPDLPPRFTGALIEAGVRLHVFEPCRRLFGLRTKWFRRMHRKLVVVDGQRAFVGGINYSADHLADFGPQAKHDYAVEVEGPLVAHIHRFATQALGERRPPRAHWWQRRGLREGASPVPPAAGEAQAMLVTRDNHEHRDDIERHYRAAIRSARREVIIANAYFFPGYRLLRELRRAAQRGVDVKLVLQGQPDMPIVKWAAELLHGPLLRAGVQIHEYCRRPLHGKVAVVDDEWATVGSSNLDPLSLALNLEANVVILDAGFNRQLRERLHALIEKDCRQLDASSAPPRTAWRLVLDFAAYHFTRKFPAWAGWLPAHTPRLASPDGAEGGEQPAVGHRAHHETP